jgi:hypothetical protein
MPMFAFVGGVLFYDQAGVRGGDGRLGSMALNAIDDVLRREWVAVAKADTVTQSQGPFGRGVVVGQGLRDTWLILALGRVVPDERVVDWRSVDSYRSFPCPRKWRVQSEGLRGEAIVALPPTLSSVHCESAVE